MGRAARNVDGKAVLYADVMTDSIKRAIEETGRRRELQRAYNVEHGLTPETIRTRIHDILSSLEEADYVDLVDEAEIPAADLDATVTRLKGEMMAAAADLDFERAAELRDRISELQERQMKVGTPGKGTAGFAPKEKNRRIGKGSGANRSRKGWKKF